MSTGKRLVQYALDYKKLLIYRDRPSRIRSSSGFDGTDDCEENY